MAKYSRVKIIIRGLVGVILEGGISVIQGKACLLLLEVLIRMICSGDHIGPVVGEVGKKKVARGLTIKDHY